MSLSLLIYLAEVLENMGTVLMVTGTLLTCVFIVFLIGSGISYLDRDTLSSQDTAFYLTSKPLLISTGCIALAFSLVSTFFPTKQTVYLMAGAQIGTEVLSSEIAQDVYDILKQEIKKIKNESAGEKK